MKNDSLETESKIKESARKLFQKNGFVATTIRDIAKEADINVALVNYYFRSKKKLFDLIMLETISNFFSGMAVFLNNPKTTFSEKLHLFAAHYIDFLIKNPDVPAFIMNEIRINPEEYVNKIGLKEQLHHSIFVKQFLNIFCSKENAVSPFHFFMNLSALIAFPFVSSPMIKATNNMTEKEFEKLMQERKALIPKWIEAMIEMS